MLKRIILAIAVTGSLLFLIQACATELQRNNYRDVNSFLHDSNRQQGKPFLKAHLKNGEVSIFKDGWKVLTAGNTLVGTGTTYDMNRHKIYEGELLIPIDSVAIFETNERLTNPESARVSALGLVAGLDVLIGIICLTTPKACYGSCPTFYIHPDDNFHYADAEGFSNAISPSMEYADIDALHAAPSLHGRFSITMKNEALETHCVNDVKLLAYPVKEGEHVYEAHDKQFYKCSGTIPLQRATGAEGDITRQLKTEDRQERFSLADGEQLNSKEDILLDFGSVPRTGDLGLILNFRQTLMTTYFIYSAMGYMGDEVSDIFAQLELNPDNRKKLEGGLQKELGNIDVYRWDEQTRRWTYVDGCYETGPIAFNRQILPLRLPAGTQPVKLKVVLNKGLWRLDYFALTEIREAVQPLEIAPTDLYNKGTKDSAGLAQINNPRGYLLSMPGSAYTFHFDLPEKDARYDLFLYSKGYYLEWMRDHWIKDKDLLKLRQMLDEPAAYLREEAKAYKRYEADMEAQFWGSRIDTKSFSYYEK